MNETISVTIKPFTPPFGVSCKMDCKEIRIVMKIGRICSFLVLNSVTECNEKNYRVQNPKRLHSFNPYVSS